MTTNTVRKTLQQDEIPAVELDFMNATHVEELKIVREIGELIDTFITANSNEKHSDENQDALSQKLNTWLEHTISHFERENALMQETGFPAYEIHASEHAKALNFLRELINAWSEKQDIELVKSYVFSAWPTWFEQHVNTMDMMTAKFAVMNGYPNP